MPVFQLDERLLFPPPELADPDGLLAVGGDLCAERLLLAYANGIFPWPAEGLPLLWHSPDPRFVLDGRTLHVSRSLRRVIRRGRYHCTFDARFDDIIAACSESERPRQDGTWITPEMVEAYRELHRLGFAHSVEAWDGDELAGGLYGVSLGAAFFGESMVAFQPDASKVAFVTMVERVARWGIHLIDSQVHTSHLERFGAKHISRRDYLRALSEALQHPTRRGTWQLGEEP